MQAQPEPAQFHTYVMIYAKDHESEWRAATESHCYGWVITAGWDLVASRIEPVLVTIESRTSWLSRPSHWLTPADPLAGKSAVQPTAVNADAVRRLPLGAILAEGRRGLRERAAREQSRFGELAKRLGFQLEPLVNAQRGAQRGRRLTDDDLREVAAAYREAWSQGEPVNDAVRERCKLSRDGAAKRIMAARAAGLLDGVGPRR